MGLWDFFTPEEGQKRRKWLETKMDELVAEPMNYFLGPTGIPSKVQAVGSALEFTDAGDMQAAADASRNLWNNPTIGNAAEFTAAGIALGLPMYSQRMGEGIADLADEMVEGFDPYVTSINLGGIKARHPDTDISLTGTKDRGYTLNKIVVPKHQRGSGAGTDILDDLSRQADDEGATIALTPSSDFGGNKRRLIDFYKRFGFVENKGRNRDYSISEDMYRLPR